MSGKQEKRKRKNKKRIEKLETQIRKYFNGNKQCFSRGAINTWHPSMCSSKSRLQNISTTHVSSSSMYVGGRVQGTIPVKNVHVNKKALYGVLYGNPPIPICGAQSGRIHLPSTNEDDNPCSIMCHPVLTNRALETAGYAPACATCRYSIHCLRGKHPNVCSHCRAAVLQHTVRTESYETQIKYDARSEKEYCRLQSAEERVSAACPLFIHAVMTCLHCDESRAYVTRVRIPNRVAYKTINVRRAPKKTEKTFREHLASFQKTRRKDIERSKQ